MHVLIISVEYVVDYDDGEMEEAASDGKELVAHQNAYDESHVYNTLIYKI